MSRKHIVGSVHRHGQENKVFVTLVASNLKNTEANFSTILTDMLYLRVTQMPRSPDLAIFMLMTDNTDYFTPCACVRGNDRSPACNGEA